MNSDTYNNFEDIMLTEKSIMQLYIMYDSSVLLFLFFLFLVLEQAEAIFDERSQNSDCFEGWGIGFTGEGFKESFQSDRDLDSHIVKSHPMLHVEFVHFTC